MEVPAPKGISYAQYLEAEGASEQRHEWIAGEVYAMAGATEEHAFLGTAIASELRSALRGRPCRPLSGDMRIRSLRTGEAHYADVAVVCGTRIPHPEDVQSCTNPTALVEVLSPSTEAYDRGEKFEDYQTLETLRDYVLVSTRRNHVDHYTWIEAGAWLLRSHGPGTEFTLSGCGATLSVDAIYEGVEAARASDDSAELPT